MRERCTRRRRRNDVSSNVVQLVYTIRAVTFTVFMDTRQSPRGPEIGREHLRLWRVLYVISMRLPGCVQFEFRTLNYPRVAVASRNGNKLSSYNEL